MTVHELYTTHIRWQTDLETRIANRKGPLPAKGQLNTPLHRWLKTEHPRLGGTPEYQTLATVNAVYETRFEEALDMVRAGSDLRALLLLDQIWNEVSDSLLTALLRAAPEAA